MSIDNGESDTECSPLVHACAPNKPDFSRKVRPPHEQLDTLENSEEWPKTPDATDADAEMETCCCCCGYGKKKTNNKKRKQRRTEKIFNDLWDEPDARFLDKVSCKALIRIMAVDPKNSRFEVRMHCQWQFRTLHTKESTETHLRVPGIRVPGIIVTVDESRIWRDMQKAKHSEHTVFWTGVSVFTMTGFERFEMNDFPFDRQKMSLGLVEFVWRSEFDSMDHTMSMHICALSVATESMLPEWDPAPAIIEAEKEFQQTNHKHLEQPPNYASRFHVALRIERKNWYYIMQVFGLTILITISSCFPLCMPPSQDHIGDRLALYAGGLLTLTAFKYGIADQLPSVPYSTKFDRILFMQMVTLMVLALESLIAYRIIEYDADEDALELTRVFLLTHKTCDIFEDIVFLIIVFGWLSFWYYLAADQLGFPCGLKRRSWEDTMLHQEKQTDVVEVECANSNGMSELHTKELELETLNQHIFKHLAKKKDSNMNREKIQEFHDMTRILQAKRHELELEISSSKPS